MPVDVDGGLAWWFGWVFGDVELGDLVVVGVEGGEDGVDEDFVVVVDVAFAFVWWVEVEGDLKLGLWGDGLGLGVPGGVVV